MAKVRIKIDKFGNPTILDVCGTGTNCMEATKNFEKMLGQTQESSRAVTDSYYEHEELDPQELTLEDEGDV